MLTNDDVLIALTTYDGYPYIDLSLTAYESFPDAHHVCVIDDGSNSDKLREVCAKHQVQLLGVDRPRRKHLMGMHCRLLWQFAQRTHKVTSM